MTLSTGQVLIGDEDRATLVSWTHWSSARAGSAMRAKIVLAAADGEANVLVDFALAGGVAADGDPMAGTLRRCGSVWA